VEERKRERKKIRFEIACERKKSAGKAIGQNPAIGL
jgi:hypothetical protein